MAPELCDRCAAYTGAAKGILTVRIDPADALSERIMHRWIEEDGDVVKTACGEIHSVQSPALGRAR
jgi:hypothetical protein